MKQLLIILNLCFLCSSLLIAQSTYDVDVAPLLIGCEGSDQEKVDCTTETLYNYMTVDIQNEACAAVDTSKNFMATINVKPNGKATIKKPFTLYKQDSHPCVDYFNQKLVQFLDEYDYLPARKSSGKTEFDKKISLVYPSVKKLSIDEEPVYKIVDQMPRFNGCESMVGTSLDKEPCAQTKMLQYIYQTLLYPASARANNIEGMVVTRFVVNTDGYLENFEVVRGVDCDLDAAALATMKSMNDLPEPPFVPGKQFGEPVKVQYVLPVRFKLEGNSSSHFQKRKSRRNNKD